MNNQWMSERDREMVKDFKYYYSTLPACQPYDVLCDNKDLY